MIVAPIPAFTLNVVIANAHRCLLLKKLISAKTAVTVETVEHGMRRHRKLFKK